MLLHDYPREPSTAVISVAFFPEKHLSSGCLDCFVCRVLPESVKRLKEKSLQQVPNLIAGLVLGVQECQPVRGSEVLN